MAPESLRDDLVRAVGSNGRVDVTGERSHVRTALPAAVKRMGAAFTDSVQQCLLELPSSDESGMQYINPPAARKLAAAAVSGQLRVVDFVKETRILLGSGSSPEGVARRVARSLEADADGVDGGGTAPHLTDCYGSRAGEGGRSHRCDRSQHPRGSEMLGGVVASSHGYLGDAVRAFQAAERAAPVLSGLRAEA